MDLLAVLPVVSWRRFQVLLRGLSPNSATVARLHMDIEMGRRGEKVHTVAGPKAAQSAFVSLFGGAKPTG
jgi:hypothetical protein